MNLTEQINADIKTAMLAKDAASLRALRAVKSALLLLQTSGTGEISADDEIKLLQKLVKQRKESIDIYVTQSREDLAEPEKEEVAVIEKYLPAQMSEAEIKSQLQGLIDSVGAKSAADLGKVMGAASKHFAGKADNKVVSALIKEMLG